MAAKLRITTWVERVLQCKLYRQTKLQLKINWATMIRLLPLASPTTMLSSYKQIRLWSLEQTLWEELIAEVGCQVTKI